MHCWTAVYCCKRAVSVSILFPIVFWLFGGTHATARISSGLLPRFGPLLCGRVPHSRPTAATNLLTRYEHTQWLLDGGVPVPAPTHVSPDTIAQDLTHWRVCVWRSPSSV